MKKIADHFEIQSLGKPKIPSPLTVGYFKSDDERVLCDISIGLRKALPSRPLKSMSLEVAGPRHIIFFEPQKVKAAVVSCGGLCPGINDVIRALVMELHHRYGVRNIIGVKYGLQGLIPRYGHDFLELSTDVVKDIQDLGGSILSSSRGNQDITEMVDALERMNINLFFVIGGDGTMQAAQLITDEIARRKLKIGVIGIPKTIDNDLVLIQKSFGFDTAISEAVKTIQCAHVEAKGAPMGIGLVKLMGRQSGHIAASAALAQGDANFVLIPEEPFALEGDNGFLRHLERRLGARNHAVIIVAEGAGQNLFSRKGNGEARRLGEHPAQRHRRIPEGEDRRALPEKEDGDQSEIHRPQLHHPERAGQCQRQHPLRGSCAVCRPCRDGRQNGHARGPRQRRLRPHALPGRRGPEENDRPQGQHLDARPRVDGAAPLHEELKTTCNILRVGLSNRTDFFLRGVCYGQSLRCLWQGPGGG